MSALSMVSVGIGWSVGIAVLVSMGALMVPGLDGWPA